MFNVPEEKEIVFVDIEANDFPKRILQFGAVKLFKDNKIIKKNWFCNPNCKLSPHILKIVGKNIAKIEKGMNSLKMIQKINDFLDNTILISFSNFDYKFLNEMSIKFLKKELNVVYFDLQSEWKKLAMTKEVWALNRLASFFKIKVNVKNLHDASYDAFLLSQIYLEWKNHSEKEIIKNIYKTNAVGLKRIKTSQNKSNKNALTLNNINQEHDFCFLKIEFSDYVLNETKIKILKRLDVLEVNHNNIKRNWNYLSANIDEFFDYEKYQTELVSCLKQYIICTRNKKLVINETDFHKIVKINNLCALYLDLFPLNTIMFTNGFSKLYDLINIENEKLLNNLELIKNWKVCLYINNEMD